MHLHRAPRHHRFPVSIISHAVWRYHRFNDSYRDIKEELAYRNIIVSHEAIRSWCNKFASHFREVIRKSERKPKDKWHLDEMSIKINGEYFILWRAVDADGYELDVYLQKRRNKKSAIRFLTRLLGCYPSPRLIVTDKLKSYIKPIASPSIPITTYSLFCSYPKFALEEQSLFTLFYYGSSIQYLVVQFKQWSSIMNKVLNNKNHLYLLLTAVLFGFTMLLNATNKIVGCALVFVLLTITANFISELYGKRKTMQSLALCSMASIGLLWNSNYYINDVKINILFASFAAVMISIYCGISVVGRLKSTYNFHVASFISLIVASVADSAVMGVALLNKFSITKVSSIFVSDILVKFSYSVTASLLLVLGVYLVQQVRKFEA